MIKMFLILLNNAECEKNKKYKTIKNLYVY